MSAADERRLTLIENKQFTRIDQRLSETHDRVLDHASSGTGLNCEVNSARRVNL
jgi:hypothetical protein